MGIYFQSFRVDSNIYKPYCTLGLLKAQEWIWLNLL
jgi:hypothetical protein